MHHFIEWEHQHGRKIRRLNLFRSSHTSPVWKTLWSMRVPAKIKINCWRALMGAIPCMGILANRHIPTSSQCPLCKLDCESLEHALFQFLRVKEVWFHLGMEKTTLDACNMERLGQSVLADLLLSHHGVGPRLPEVANG
jgi:hypothetical protein